MQELSDPIDLNSAAQLAGVHRTTIFRAIRKGELHASKLQQDGHKPQYFLEKRDFEKWAAQRNLSAQVASCSENVQAAPVLQHEQLAPNVLHDFNQNLAEALRQADQARVQCQQAWEESRRLERQVTMLQFELTKYQHALSESAESLQEARAKETEAIAKLENAQPVDLPVVPEIHVELKEARTQLEFAERRFNRIPRWLRKIFGT